MIRANMHAICSPRGFINKKKEKKFNYTTENESHHRSTLCGMCVNERKIIQHHELPERLGRWRWKCSWHAGGWDKSLHITIPKTLGKLSPNPSLTRRLSRRVFCEIKLNYKMFASARFFFLFRRLQIEDDTLERRWQLCLAPNLEF